MYALGAAGGLVLRDLALVVREHQVHAATVDIELAAEVFFAHHRALEVPARETFAPGGRPAHDVFGLRLLPEGEVVGGALVALPVQRAGAFQGVVEVAPGQDAVVEVAVVLLHVEIDAAVALVGIAGGEDLLHGLYLLDDVARGARFDGGRRHVQQAHRLVVAQGIGLHDLHRLQLLQPGLLRDLVLPFVGIVLQVSHVRDVADIAHPVAQVAQELAEHVVGHARPGVAEVGVAVDGRPADVHPHVAGMDGLEEFLPAGQCIGNEEFAHNRSWIYLGEDTNFLRILAL